ncbi:MAG: hypothetical protein ACRD2H_06120 [Terriglobales bacterium]
MHRLDHRPWQQRVRDHYVVWGYILGLSVGLLVWALIAYAAIGNETIHEFKYYIPNPTPAAVPYNQVDHRAGQQAQ